MILQLKFVYLAFFYLYKSRHYNQRGVTHKGYDRDVFVDFMRQLKDVHRNGYIITMGGWVDWE